MDCLLTRIKRRIFRGEIKMSSMFDIGWTNILAWVSVGWITYLPIAWWLQKK